MIKSLNAYLLIHLKVKIHQLHEDIFYSQWNPCIAPRVRRAAVALVQTHSVSGFRKDSHLSAGVRCSLRGGPATGLWFKGRWPSWPLQRCVDSLPGNDPKLCRREFSEGSCRGTQTPSVTSVSTCDSRPSALPSGCAGV